MYIFFTIPAISIYSRLFVILEIATEPDITLLFRNCNISDIIDIDREEIDLLEDIPINEDLSTSRDISNIGAKVLFVDQNIGDLQLLPPSNLNKYLFPEDALKDINDFAATQGYTMVKARSSVKKGKGINRVCFRYWRGGDYDNRGFRLYLNEISQRVSQSIKIGCKVSIVLYCRIDGEWELLLRETEHNYLLSPAINIPYHRHLIVKEKTPEIEEVLQNGIFPWQIVASFMAKGLPIRPKNIYNIKVNLNCIYLGGCSSI